MLLFFLFNCVILTNFSFAEKYASTLIYGDVKCQNINLITYSYENLEFCNNEIILNKCNTFNQLTNFSTQSLCGDNSLEYTKKKFNNDFIYTEVYDQDCNNKTGAVAIVLNKCFSFMGTNFIKITKDKNNFNSKVYSDNNCKTEIKVDENPKKNTNDVNQPLDLQKCVEKIKIYTKDGLLNNKNNEDNSNKNSENNIQNSANNEKNSLILTFSLMIFVIITVATNY